MFTVLSQNKIIKVMEKTYKHYLQESLTRCKIKLKEIEKVHGKNSERWHIANEHILSLKFQIENGIPKNVNQSTEIPYDLTEEF